MYVPAVIEAARRRLRGVMRALCGRACPLLVVDCGRHPGVDDRFIRAGWETVVVHSAEDAIERIGETDFGLVLVDMRLPAKGLEAAAELAAWLALTDLGVAAVLDDAALAPAARAAGCCGVVTADMEGALLTRQLIRLIDADPAPLQVRVETYGKPARQVAGPLLPAAEPLESRAAQ
jgi:hypothetical protein